MVVTSASGVREGKTHMGTQTYQLLSQAAVSVGKTSAAQISVPLFSWGWDLPCEGREASETGG